MAKLYALSRIILPANGKDGEEQVVVKGKVFDASPEQARQFDALTPKASRAATAEEIKAAKAEFDRENGIVSAEPEVHETTTETTGNKGR